MSDFVVNVDFVHKVIQVDFDKDTAMAATTLMRAAAEAAASAERAETWAEGIDAQVEELGGEHSSKSWATISGSSANAAHDSEVAAKASEDAAAQSAAEAAGINYLVRKNSTAYAVGVVAFYSTVPSPLVLECTTAGTTASVAPDFSGAVEDDTISDGTVVWTYKSLLGGSGGGSGGAGVSIGTIFAHGSSTNPEGALLCDGAAVSRTMYADLFDTVGTKYGSGDGSTTFNLPDLTDAIISKTVTKTAYTTAGSSTFTAAKSGLYKITIKGGGGGGQTGVTNYSGAGGGEGGTTITYQQLSVGDTATITVGAGGATETNGGDSSVVVNSTTYTGGGGYAGNNGGGGGTGTIPGAPGGENIYYTTDKQAGGSGGGAGGGKANFSITSASDANGVSGGGGAGGFTNHYSPPFYTGGAGGDGYVWIEYLGDATAYYIQAFNASTDPALVDLTQIVQDLANKATRSLDNLTAAGEAKLANASGSVVYKDGFAIIYPNGGTEANPANVDTNSRYVEANPFPGYYVNCVAEIQAGGNWGDSRWESGSNAYGTMATQFFGNGEIVVQTGSARAFLGTSAETGSPFGTSSGSLSSAPCRVKVWKIGKVANNA